MRGVVGVLSSSLVSSSLEDLVCCVGVVVMTEGEDSALLTAGVWVRGREVTGAGRSNEEGGVGLVVCFLIHGCMRHSLALILFLKK